MRSGAIRMGKSAASPASSARRCARRSPSTSNRSSVPTARGAPPATTSTSRSASSAASARRPALWLLLRAEFLAIALVVVYVGAVMVLFLFVVMMLDINLERVREGFWRNLPLALVVGVIMVWEMVTVVAYHYWGTGTPAPLPARYSNTKALGLVLYTDYAYAFEIAAVILLVA